MHNVYGWWVTTFSVYIKKEGPPDGITWKPIELIVMHIYMNKSECVLAIFGNKI